jgi:Meiotically up-regulated gene 113
MIYFIKCGEFVKIGRSSNPQIRLTDMQIETPYDLELVGLLDGNGSEEKRLHSAFSQFRKRGEWFHLTKQITKFIKEHCTAPESEPLIETDEEPEPIVGAPVREDCGFDVNIWLADQLDAGPAPIAELTMAASKLGISRNRLYEAAERIGVRVSPIPGALNNAKQWERSRGGDPISGWQLAADLGLNESPKLNGSDAFLSDGQGGDCSNPAPSWSGVDW